MYHELDREIQQNLQKISISCPTPPFRPSALCKICLLIVLCKICLLIVQERSELWVILEEIENDVCPTR
jgi:hypothetical protein